MNCFEPCHDLVPSSSAVVTSVSLADGMMMSARNLISPHPSGNLQNPNGKNKESSRYSCTHGPPRGGIAAALPTVDRVPIARKPEISHTCSRAHGQLGGSGAASVTRQHADSDTVDRGERVQQHSQRGRILLEGSGFVRSRGLSRHRPTAQLDRCSRAGKYSTSIKWTPSTETAGRSSHIMWNHNASVQS